MAYNFSDLKSNYDQVIEIIATDLKTLKTGRAKPSLVEDVKVDAYGSQMQLKELASITAPDPHMIVIAPWDQSVLEAIEKALMAPPVSMNPVVDGQQVRISIPPLTGERREEMVKQVAQKVESGKQMLRNERVETKKLVEGQEGSAGISEDDIAADLKELDVITKNFTEKLEKMGDEKSQELRTI